MNDKIKFKKYKKINYHNRKFENPFFRKKKKINIIKFKLSWRKRMGIIGILFVIIFLVWFFCFSSFFDIKNIEINGLNRTSNEEIKSLAWKQSDLHRFLMGSQKNLILFNKKELIDALNQKYYFENLVIKKSFPKTLIVEIQEKSNAFIWNESERYYYCDINGYIINEVNPLEIKQKEYPLIQNNGDNKISENGYEKIDIDEEYINYAINLLNNFKDDLQDFKIEKFIVDNDVDTIKMVILDGPVMYFNIKEDCEKQIDKMFIIKNEKLKDDFKNKNYIDLRYGDKVYYR